MKKFRVKAIFGNPPTELAAKAVNGIIFGDWTNAIDDDVYDIAVEKFLEQYPECNSWNLSIEEQEEIIE